MPDLRVTGTIRSTDWIEHCPAAITVCDRDGTIVAMNEQAHNVFLKDGGRALIGSNVYGCHPESSFAKLHEIFDEGKTNCYTIEKNGIKKLIYQFPWREGGEIAGVVELSMEIPFEMPHFVRA